MNRLNGGMLPRYRIALVRESEAPFTSFPVFHNSAELFEAFREEFAALDRESFCVVTLDAKNRMIGIHTAAVGSLSSSIVVPRLCVRTHKRGYVVFTFMFSCIRSTLISADFFSIDAT